MINLTKLYCGVDQPADALRYGQGHGAPTAASERRPVVVWSITRTCNLRCVHCYSNSETKSYPNELTLEECHRVIEDLADYKVPAVLFSGGEPIVHPSFFDLATTARAKGLRLTLSTNGTLIDRPLAERLKSIGFSYVGISLDGIGETHDMFRGKKGAFDQTVAGFRHCKAVGQKVGLRLTLTRHTVEDLTRILDFIEQEDIERVCFYHLVYSGRGSRDQRLTPEMTRSALDRILDRTRTWVASGHVREVLTVGQPADGIYLYLRLLRENSERAAKTLEFLNWNGGGANSSGRGIANIDSEGNVHPDQFWQTYTLGNVREKPFSKIWSESADALLEGLRARHGRLKGRCAQCKYLQTCGGGFRVRAAQVTGDPWESDPACYLDDADVLSLVK